MIHIINEFIKYFKQTPRELALSDEAGFIVTSWPQNDWPENAPVYSDEIWPAYKNLLSGRRFLNMGKLGML
ncbi:hypothetical protein [Saccharicrinis sp. GN24d3]|uniref:hypothetical protein n=1 Tax=Saccharicrinis sp. GN24d3 TaxID=3458416 RepID=UPI00403713F9